MCFAIGYYLRLKKVIIIFVLRKESKINYLLLGSYRLIALKNTLNKILKRVITECIANIVKEYALLLQSQIRAKKNHLTLSAFILFISIIKTI